MSKQFFVRSVVADGASVQEQQLAAPDELTLRSQLQSAGHTVLSVKPISASLWARNTLDRQQFPLFCKEVRTLIRAGMTVVEAVDTLSRRSASARQQVNLASLLFSKLQLGQSLSVALEGLPDTPPVLVAAVRAGEHTNNLAEALDDYLRFDSLIEQLRRKVISASIYPALVTVLGLGISVFLLMIVMPNFARMYQNLRGKATGSTAVMIDFSQFLSSHRTEVFAAITALLLVGIWWIRSGLAKQAMLRLALSVPWLRVRVQDFQLAMMYQALALLLKGGYAMAQAMQVAGQSALSVQLRTALSQARSSIEQGASVAQSLSDAGLCDEVDRRLMAAAERNGNFYMATDVVSRMHGERFELFVERVTRIVEPVLLLLVALLVGSIVVMMYLPVFDMATRLR
jgi:general secretion pathway protein F